MKFSGDIVITDPCYMKNSKNSCAMQRGTIYGDWSCMVYPGKLEENKKYEEWNEHYFKFFNDYNFTGKTKDEKKAMREEFNKFKEEWKKNILGEFCADSGQVGVFEWDKLSTEDQKWALERPWCATIIKDFSGEVEFEIEIQGDTKSVHVVGYSHNGQNDFFSVQSGY